MKLTQRKINMIYEFLASLETVQGSDGTVRTDKNIIADRQVRAAVIDNLIALDTPYSEFRKNLSLLNEKYVTERYRQLSDSLRRETDDGRRKELVREMEEERGLWAADYERSVERLLEKETEADLAVIDRNAFDAATEDIPVSVMAYVRLKELFKK